MKIIGFVGWSGSGKTTLIVRLIPVLLDRGVSVSTIKHAHHDFEIDQPGKDSFEHRAAGAGEVLVSSARRWALIHEHRGAPEPNLEELIAHLSSVDLVIVEGFKRHAHDKIGVHRKGNRPPLSVPEGHLVAVASDEPLAEVTLPVLALDDAPAIAEFIIAHCGLAARDLA